MRIKLRTLGLIGLLGFTGCATPIVITNTILNEMASAHRIKYVADKEWDYWQTPKETEERWQGDCEDYAIYLQDRLAKKGIKTDLVFGKIRNTDPYYHSWIELNANGNRYILDAALNKIFINPTREYLDCTESCAFKNKVIAFKNRDLYEK